MKYIALFTLIQLVNIPLWILGFPICALLSVLHAWHAETSPVTGRQILVWPAFFWLWSNDEDGVKPDWYVVNNPTWSATRIAFTWTAWRNSVNNLRFVPGVSGKGRPLWIHAYLGGYFMAGWRSDGWPVFHPWTRTLT